MKHTLSCIAATFICIMGYSEESLYFLSSDKIFHERQASLKEMHSFTFFPLLKMDSRKTIDLITQELEKVGVVVQKPILTSEGANLESFSNPLLQFSIEQLVDLKNHPLPVLRATLSVNTVGSLNSIYVEKIDDVQEVIKQTLPILLNQFMKGQAGQKPTFYISYDASWWDAPPEQK